MNTDQLLMSSGYHLLHHSNIAFSSSSKLQFSAFPFRLLRCLGVFREEDGV
jgi:hypothetical protein